MFDLKISTNGNDIVAAITKIAADQNKAVRRALNKTAISARADASKQIRDAGYNIKASAIKSSFSLRKATDRCLEVVLVSTGKPIALINFSARPTRSGVSFNIKGSRHVMRHAFIASMSNGHIGVFERIGIARIKGAKGSRIGKNNKPLRANLPVRELFGPSIPGTLANPLVQDAIMRKIKEKFPQILKAELNFITLKGI